MIGATELRRTEPFEGSVALVTGGGRGLGRAVALALAARGAKVGILARTETQVRAVAAEIEADGGAAVAAVGSVTDVTECENCIELVTAQFGEVDILINCAGVFSYGPSTGLDPVEARRIIETNLFGTLTMCRLVGGRMVARRSGKIVNFASLLSFTAFPERAAYAASKGAVLQLTRVLGVEWAPHSVNVNAVAPGMIQIETPHPAFARGDLSADAIVRRIPLGRRGVPRDVVGPTLFLASPEADYICGQTIVVDGGWLSYGYI